MSEAAAELMRGHMDRMKQIHTECRSDIEASGMEQDDLIVVNDAIRTGDVEWFDSPGEPIAVTPEMVEEDA